MEHKITLAECKHYAVISEFEAVYLVDKIRHTEILIGDFYGDPAGAIIDLKERFVVMYGCGLIIYFLRPPYEEYTYDTKTTQWYEIGRYEPVMWIENVLQINDDEIKVIFENEETKIISLDDKFRFSNQ